MKKKLTLEEKLGFMKEFFGGKVPEYLWYNLGSASSGIFNDTAIAGIADQTGIRGHISDLMKVYDVYPNDLGGGVIPLGVPQYRHKEPMWMPLAKLIGKEDKALLVKDAKELVAGLQLPDRVIELYAATTTDHIEYSAPKAKEGIVLKVNFAKMKAYGPIRLAKVAGEYGLNFYTSRHGF